MSWLLLSSPSIAGDEPQPGEERAALIWKVRDQEATILRLERDLAFARVDSATQAGKWEVRESLLLGRITYLMDSQPRWWQKPEVLVPVTVLVTIWAVLRAVDISV